MRMNYFKAPSDYILELKRKGIDGRRKAMAFTDYVDDIERGDFGNSLRFYANAWNVGKTTAARWIDDFKKEIDLFLAHWEVVNNKMHSSVKKEVGQTGQQEWDKRDSETPRYSGQEEEQVGQVGQVERDKAFNLTTNTISDERLFEDLFFIYSQNTQYPGKKSEALESYLKVKDDATHNDFKRAIFFYLHDPKHNFQNEPRLFNAKNFFDEGAYYGYIPKHIRIKNKDEWLTGIYNTETNIFTSSTGDELGLIDEVFKKKFANGELEFIREVVS